MSFISRFKYPAAVITAGIIIAIELVVRLTPIEYTSGAGEFLTYQRKLVAEDKSLSFDFIILGDSRSLSLYGYDARSIQESRQNHSALDTTDTQDFPYFNSIPENYQNIATEHSVYNLSMPALTPRYYAWYLEKYLENRQHLPEAIIFAADPGNLLASNVRPLHDPSWEYTDQFNEGLLAYTGKAFMRRLQRAFSGENQRPASRDDMLWDIFSHRFLHLFNMRDIMKNLRGPERIFILNEALPLTWQTFKYRRGIEAYTTSARASSFQKVELPEYCGSCETVALPECHPDIHRIERNRMIEDIMNRSRGQINLGDLLPPNDRFLYLQARDSEADRLQRMANENTDITVYPLETLYEVIEKYEIELIITPVPSINRLAGTVQHRNYYDAVTKFTENHDLAHFIDFPDPYYPLELFVEHVHYDCPGAERLNQDFYSQVYPAILDRLDLTDSSSIER